RRPGRPDEAGRRSFDDGARRHVAVVVDAPDADEAGLVRVPRRRPRVGDVVVLEVVLDRRVDQPALFVDEYLADLDDAGVRSGNLRLGLRVAVIEPVEHQDRLVGRSTGPTDAAGHEHATSLAAR